MSRSVPAVAGGVAVSALVLALLLGGGVDTVEIVGLAQPGPVTTWGLPVLRLLSDVLATVTVGLVVTGAFLVPGDARSVSALAFRMLRRARLVALAWGSTALALIVFTLSDVLGRPVSALPFAAVASFAWSISQGQALLIQAVLAAAVAVVCHLALSRSTAAWAAGLALAGVLPPAFTGHAAGAGNHQIAVTSLAMHVLAASLWTGGLIALLTLHRAKALPDVAGRYSRLALVCFGAVAASGVINGVVRLGGDWRTAYGALLAGKVLALLAIGVVGAIHRTRTLPLLRAATENTRVPAENGRGPEGNGRRPEAGDRRREEGDREPEEGDRISTKNSRAPAESARSPKEGGQLSAKDGRILAEDRVLTKDRALAKDHALTKDHTATKDHALTKDRVVTGDRRPFLRLAAGEVVLFGAAFGLAAALSRSPAPIPDDTVSADPIIETVGFPMPGPLSAATLLGDPLPDLFFLTVAVAGIGAYLVGVRRLRADWPVTRTVSWIAGMLLLAAVTSLGISRYAYVMFSVHMVQHMLLSMVVPILLVLGAPVTLALRALRKPTDPRVRGPRDWLLIVVHSRVARFVTHPLAALAIYTVSLYGLYFGGVLGWLMRYHLGHLAMLAHFVLAGFLLFWVLIGVDPGRRRVAPPILVLVHFASMVVHAFFGLTLLQSTTVIAPEWYLAVHPPWAAPLLEDQQLGAAIAWAFGELPAAAVMLVLVRQWISADEREQRRVDRTGDEAHARYNEFLAAASQRVDERADR
ncbi:cytochrome c oxidase assembly protein [Catenuloplanes sp. NPDC051500]|uniref:cytochrome c oxidase assembly protein n=1 Tax=Catenuloplanes sp. NPDC051500 TaxID=3363959 RepID=UPI0037A10A1C